jgi:hypothetical protein
MICKSQKCAHKFLCGGGPGGKKAQNFPKYQLALKVPNQLALKVQIGTQSTNRYLKYQSPFLSASIWDSILQIGIWDTQ